MPDERRRRCAAAAAATAGSRERVADGLRRPPRPARGRRPRSTSTSPGRRRGRGRREAAASARGPRRAAAVRRPDGRGRSGRTGTGHRLPDLSSLPPLLAATGPSVAPRAPRRPARTVGVGAARRLVAVPHGAKTYLAAALRSAPTGERLVWIARDAEIGDRVAEELAAWLGDPAAVAVLEPRTALAYERCELVARRDGRPGRGPRRLAERPGRASSSRASRPSSSTRSRPTDLPADAARLRPGRAAPPGRAAARAVRPRLRAGRRGRRPRRVRPARRHRRRLPAGAAAARPDRVVRRRDRFAARLRSRRPADRRAARRRPCCCRRASSCCRPGGAAAIRERLGRGAARLPSGSPRTSRGSRAPKTTLADRPRPPARPAP